ncbi:hypothetical protein B5M50_06555 [candidate division KSB1 bacterium 4484_219]|nr:MAG: hypothetical protein B5M50_06555 [candidate division KSB1 bacterium 4484_219]
MRLSLGCSSLLLQFALLLVPTASIASGYVTGKVIDSKSKAPLPGANVQIMGTVRGASTDRNGNFTIEKVPPGTYSIRASMIGYRSVTLKNILVRDKQETKVFFELRETPIEFDPIVVLAGKTKQRLDQAAVSISVVSAKEIKRRNPTNLIEALETVPGINFIGNQINIRGSTGYTYGAGNKVLLLLDGVPVYASDTGEFNWDMLPPLDIKRIEVLKGAGSTLWGASALGGVVNVITPILATASNLDGWGCAFLPDVLCPLATLNSVISKNIILLVSLITVFRTILSGLAMQHIVLFIEVFLFSGRVRMIPMKWTKPI